jgi:uncharacterized DUF497 family protein
MHIPSDVSYEWDDEKNRTNRRKHGVDFADAVSALEEGDALTMHDDDSDEEDRFVTLGLDSLGTPGRGENIRMISARQATRRETATYEDKR